MDEVAVESAPVDSGSDSGASLQSEMTGDFFVDDGCGAVVDNMGNKQLNENNEPLRTMDEFNAFKAKRNSSQPQPTPMAKTGNTARPVQPQAQRNFDSIFEKNGQIDFGAINDHSKRIGSFQYQSSTLPKPTQGQPVPIKAAIDPVAQIKTDVDKYSKELSDVRLKPIESAYNKLAVRYGGEANIPAEVRESLNEEYLAQRDAIRDLVDARKDELKDKHFQEQLSQKDSQTLELKSKENFSSVAKDFFPSAPNEKQAQILEELIFGYKVGDKYVPGPGAEIVNFLFDQNNKSAEFKTPQEWADAYNKFWVDFSNNPNNVKWLAKKAYESFMHSNEPKRRDAYRSAWEKEQSEKLKMQTIQKPNAVRGGNLGTPDAATQQLNKFIQPPSRNM